MPRCALNDVFDASQNTARLAAMTTTAGFTAFRRRIFISFKRHIQRELIDAL